MYENETIKKIEKCYYMNVTVGSALKGVAQTAGGAALGGILGHGMMNASQKALNNSQIHGSGILTNTRYVFGEGRNLNKLTANAPLTVAPRDEIHFDIPFSAIKSVSLGRHGVYHAWVIETEEREFKFAIRKRDIAEEWVAALQQALTEKRAAPEYVSCPNCARRVSETDAFCPGCGYAPQASAPAASAAEENQILSGGVFDFGIWKLLKYEISDSGWTRLGERGMYTGPNGGKYGAQIDRRIDKTKGQILKIWLLGLFGTLGFHYFAAGRFLTGLFQFLWGASWWTVTVLCAFDAEMQQYPRLFILFFVLLLTPSLFCFFTKIIWGRFRDVFNNHIS